MGERDGAPGLRLLKTGRHLVHGVVTLTDRAGKLVTLQFDHGTVQSIGGGSLTILEAGGGMESVTTSRRAGRRTWQPAGYRLLADALVRRGRGRTTASGASVMVAG